MTAKGMHDHEGFKFCDWCHETLYAQRVINLSEEKSLKGFFVIGVWTWPWWGDHWGEKAEGGQGVGGEGKEAQGDRRDEE